MQHMDAPAGLPRQLQQARRGPHRRLLVAPDRMHGHVARPPCTSARRSRRRASSSEWTATRRRPLRSTASSVSSSGTSRLPVELPMKIFTPAQPGCAPARPSSRGILVGGARRRRRCRTRPGPWRGRACRRVSPAVSVFGVGVGHLEDRGDAAEHRRGRARRQVFLVGQARLAEMHLGIDDAGQRMQAPARRTSHGGGAVDLADGGEPAVADADIGAAQCRWAWRRSRHG